MPDEAEAVHERLLQWGLNHGAEVHRDLDLFATGAFGARGVVARAPITTGEVLMRIPTMLTMQGPLVAQPEGSLGDFFRGLEVQISNVLRLTLTLVHELHVAKSKSSWWPYLEFLATTVKPDVLFVWSADSIEDMKGTTPCLKLDTQILGEDEAPADTKTIVFNRDVLPVMIAGGDLWPEHVREQSLFWECLTWIMSRGVQGGISYALDGSLLPALEYGIGGKDNGPFMLPLYDQLNHSSFADMRSAMLHFESEAFVLRAERNISCGEEVLISYGQHSDAELLRTYGFVEGNARGNPNNCLLIAHSEVLAGCSQALGADHIDAGRLECLRTRNVEQPVYCVPASGVLPTTLITVIQALLMNQKEFEEFRTSDLGSLGEEFHTRDTQLGARVTACAMLILAQTRKRYGELKELESDVRHGSRQSMARQVRMGELAVLRSAQSYVITKLAPKTSALQRGGKRKKASGRALQVTKVAKTEEAESLTTSTGTGACASNSGGTS